MCARENSRFSDRLRAQCLTVYLDSGTTRYRIELDKTSLLNATVFGIKLVAQDDRNKDNDK
ncbi:hypothetical protein D3C87_1780970 [compost metagenome]